MFIAQEKAIKLLTDIRPLLPLIERNDRDLADQLRRAATSVVLNLAEGSKSGKGNKGKHFAIAHGSASEVRAALHVAVAWGWIDAASASPATLDEVLAILWRLTHPRVR